MSTEVDPTPTAVYTRGMTAATAAGHIEPDFASCAFYAPSSSDPGYLYTLDLVTGPTRAVRVLQLRGGDTPADGQGDPLPSRQGCDRRAPIVNINPTSGSVAGAGRSRKPLLGRRARYSPAGPVALRSVR